jgi:transcription initiation factor IIE alpha subunit
MFGKKSGPCMVFEYGCLPPISGEEALLDQLRRKNKLWNELVAVERNYRENVRSNLIEAELDNKIKTLVDELENIKEEINKRKKRARSGRVDLQELKARAKELKNQLKQLRTEAKEIKKRLAEENKELLDEAETERRKLQKAAQRESGLYWCNYDDVIASYTIARRRVISEKRQLQFHRFDGTGKVFVRWQNGLPVSELFNCRDTRLQIDPVPENAWYSEKRSERRKLSRTKIRIRVGSDENKKPVWCELPMVMHRPLPENGVIRNAAVVRERVGNRYRYKAVITVEIQPVNLKSGNALAVGIDIGWRAVEGGLRVAYCKDEMWGGGPLVIPERTLSQFKKLDDLKSIRDKHFNDAKEILATWLKGKIVPAWLADYTVTLAQWRNKERLASLVRKWQENRFPGDQEIVAYLEEWQKRDKHLWNWEANLRDQIIKRRREMYRIFAASIAKKYGYVFIEDFNLRSVARKPAPEDGTKGSKPMDQNRTIAAISTLREAIINACRREGVQVIKVPAGHTTVECHVCGHKEKFDAAGHIFRTCPKCKTTWDQDENAAINILNRGLSQIERDFERKNDFRKNEEKEKGET